VLVVISLAGAWGIWKLFGIDKRWPGEGVLVTSKPGDRFVPLEFKYPQYQAEFAKLNQIEQ
jgi:hypothetical protein